MSSYSVERSSTSNEYLLLNRIQHPIKVSDSEQALQDVANQLNKDTLEVSQLNNTLLSTEQEIAHFQQTCAHLDRTARPGPLILTGVWVNQPAWVDKECYVCGKKWRAEVC